MTEARLHSNSVVRGRTIKDIKAAVAGVGFVGVIHVEALRRLGVEVVGVCAETPEIARKRGLEYPLPHVFDTFEEMVTDPRIDVVHIATPNHLHHAQVKRSLAAGKHVICEKPLALTSAESSELIKLAREAGLVCAVNFNSRYYPHAQEVRARVLRGELGRLLSIHGSYLQDWLLYDTDWNWRLDPSLGGEIRAVADIGAHWLDLAQFVTSCPIEAVFADLSIFHPFRMRPGTEARTFSVAERPADAMRVRIQTEDAAHVLLRFAGGGRGAVTISQVSAGRKNALSFEMDCSEAAVAWCSERPEELWVGHRDRPNELLLRDPQLFAPDARVYTSLPAGHAEGFQETFRELHRKVYTAIAAGEPPGGPGYPTFDDGHHEILIAEAIRKSARNQSWTTVGEES